MPLQQSSPLKFLPIVFICLLQLPVFAGMTLITRETFQGVGTVDTNNPENLTNVAGHFYKRAVGPRLTNDFTAGGLGWSADVRSQFDVNQTYDTNCPALPQGTSTAPTNAFMFDWWVWINYTGTGTGAYAQKLFALTAGSYGLIGVDTVSNSAGQPLALVSSFALTNSAAVTNWILPGNTWVNLRVAYQKRPNGYYSYDASVLSRVAGQPGFTEIGLFTNLTCYANPKSALSGFYPASAQPGVRGRYAMPSVYQLDNWTDRFDLVPDVVDPPPGPFTWYVNYGTGNDTNDGTTSTSAWQTVTKFNSEEAGSGVFPSITNVPGAGDTVIVDNTTPLDIGSNSLVIAASGSRTEFTNGPVIAYATLSPANWTKTDGWTNIWQTTDGGAADLAEAVCWEDDRWMNHPTGSNFTAVAGYIDTHPGSFYCDSTNLYVHSFEGGSPASDGHIYTRSRNRGGAGLSAITIIGASNVWVDGLSVSKTCLARSTDNDPANGYGLQFTSSDGGTNIVSNFSVNYWSKHGMGRTSNGNGVCVIRENGTYGPGSPYAGFGGQTADVDYCDIGTNNSYAYYNVNCLSNAGVIGGYGGTSAGEEFWISHAGGLCFDGGIFSNINTVAWFDELNSTVGTIFITNSTFGYGTFGCNFNIQNSQALTGPVAELNSGKTGTVFNCILNINTPITSDYWQPLAGTLTIENCDLDLRAATSNQKAIWGRSGPADLALKNDLILMNPALDSRLLYGFDTNDVFNLSNNLYQFGKTNLIGSFTNGATVYEDYVQWQALGQDANSIVVTNPLLAGDDVPETGSAAIGNGLNLSASFTTDYAGDPRPATGPWTIGAYQVAGGGGGVMITALFLPAATGSGGTLELAWPADDLGWMLQMQTNSLNVGLSTNWVDVPGSGAITQTNIGIDPSMPLMFFRLRSP